MSDEKHYRDKCFEVRPYHCSICTSKKQLEVHHIDGNRDNNNLSNLKPVCRECHMAIHGGYSGYKEWERKIEREDQYNPLEWAVAYENTGKWEDNSEKESNNDSDYSGEWLSTVPNNDTHKDEINVE